MGKQSKVDQAITDAGGRHFSSMAWMLAALVSTISGALYVYENLVYLNVLQKLPNPDYAAAAALQTENAFYYSYYNEIVEAESAVEGLKQIIWDRRTEYPDVLNAIRRFNVYQEIVVALEYRCLRSVGIALPHPFDFFRSHLLLLNGVGQASLGLLAAEISGNPLAGAACFLASFINRFQISRLGNYTSSDLRELWGIPLLWVQVYFLWRLLLGSRRGMADKCSYTLWLCFIVTTFAFIVSWQFSPFLLLLQATALYFVCIVAGYGNIRRLVSKIIDAYILALMLAVAVHFASPYLLTSPFFFQLVALKLSTSVFCCRRHSRPGSWRNWLLGRVADVGEGLVALVGFVLVRKALASFATADTHVYEILCTKVSAVNDMLPQWMQLQQSQLPACAEPSFNANLYLIMGVFKLLEWSSVQVYFESSAGYAAAGSCFLVLVRCGVSTILREPQGRGKREPEVDPNTSSNSSSTVKVSATDGLRQRKGEAPASGSGKRPQGDGGGNVQRRPDGGEEAAEAEEAALLFFVVQFLLFLLLGSLVNRLRVAFGPPMMVLAATVCGPKLFPEQLQQRCPKILRAGLLAAFAVQMLWMAQMFPCLKDGEGICQHTADKMSNDGDLVDLYDWINNVVKPGTPVLASMNLAGSMRAFTHVPMIIHPQFESENLRSRVQRAYELYSCGSEASFAQTMTELKAKVVIFEYSRCFFTPYTLDDRRKNCNKKKHQTEDLMCMKLHARSRRFKLMFMNGNYAVFQLRKKPLPLSEGAREPKSADIKAWMEEPDTWKDYVHECEKTQGDKCAPRLMEAAAHFQHGLKKQKVAAELRKWALKIAPENGFVNYFMGRHLDVDTNQPKQAKQYYEKAVRLLPNNPKVLTEAILFYDLALQDPRFSPAMVERRCKIKEGSKTEEKNLLELEGPGVGLLMCEAAVAAKNGGNQKLSAKLWKRARKLSPLADCIKNNWPIINGEKDDASYRAYYTRWRKVKMTVAGGVNLEMGPHHQANVRFLGGVDFTIFPPRNKTIW